MQRLDAALLGRCKLLGNGEIFEIFKRFRDVVQALFKLDRHWRDCWRWVGHQAAPGVTKEITLISFIGRLKSPNECKGLMRGEAVSGNRIKHGILIVFGQ